MRHFGNDDRFAAILNLSYDKWIDEPWSGDKQSAVCETWTCVIAPISLVHYDV